MRSPPLNPSAYPHKPSRRSAYEPDYAKDRDAYYPTPADSDPGAPRRHRDTKRRSPSPPPRKHSSRDGDRYEDDEHASRRPHFNSSYTAPAPRTSNLRHSRESDNSRSASPREEPRHDRRHHRRSPSPRRANSARDGDRREHGRDRHHETRPHDRRRPATAGNSRHRSHSPASSSGHSSSKRTHPAHASDTRPPIVHRSKTTSAANAAMAAKDRLAHLSPRWQKAAQAALQAGSVAAFQLRSQPGAWKGEKGAKVATAALGAAAFDAFLKNRNDDNGKEKDHDNDSRSGGGHREKGGGGDKKSDVERITEAVGGFLVDQFSKKK